MFSIGDIVRPLFKTDNIEYYAVIDAFDFSKKQDGSDMEFEIVRIFPVNLSLISFTVKSSKIAVQGRYGTKEAKMIVDYVKKEQIKRGGKYLDFEKIIEDNRQRVTELKIQQDAVRYDKLDSINECLDALNDLNRLHSEFGDEAYLQLKDVVNNRIKDLMK